MMMVATAVVSDDGNDNDDDIFVSSTMHLQIRIESDMNSRDIHTGCYEYTEFIMAYF